MAVETIYGHGEWVFSEECFGETLGKPRIYGLRHCTQAQTFVYGLVLATDTALDAMGSEGYALEEIMRVYGLVRASDTAHKHRHNQRLLFDKVCAEQSHEWVFSQNFNAWMDSGSNDDSMVSMVFIHIFSV